MPQSQTADKLVAYREVEPHTNHETPGRQTEQSDQLSLFPIEVIAKLEWAHSNAK